MNDQGEFVALGLWLTLLLMWQMIRDRKARQAAATTATPDTTPTWRDWLGPPLRTSARAATSVCLLLLILYLAAVPALIDSLEKQYQQQAAFVRNPNFYWDEAQQNFEQARAELRRERGLP